MEKKNHQLGWWILTLSKETSFFATSHSLSIYAILRYVPKHWPSAQIFYMQDGK